MADLRRALDDAESEATAQLATRMEELSLKRDETFRISQTKADIRLTWKEALTVPQRGC